MTEQIKRVIAKGKPLSVIKGLITKELLRLDRVKFDEAIKSEYDSLGYWVEEVVSEAEVDEEGNVIKEEFTQPKLTEGSPTLEQYKNETRVIQEAVYEDEFVDDINVGRKLVSAEITELVRPYTPIEVTDEMIQVELDKLGYVPKEKVEAQKYLNDTDWMVVRYAEQGVEIPQEIKDKRQECRDML